VHSHLDRETGPAMAETFRQCEQDAQETQAIPPVDLVRRASKLTAWLRGLK
jgi:hypothetical protein